MKRRMFLAAASAAALLPGLARAAVGLDYRTGLVRERLKNGETVFVDFYTSWCSTCAAQGRAIEALLKENPAYEANITFVRVDWDRHSKARLSRQLQIPRRSTLVVLKGDQELGRIVAQTSKAKIRALMDTALAAAVA